MAEVVKIGKRKPGERLFLIAGPCIAESETLCIEIAGKVSSLCGRLGVDYIFKASYDKANRSSIRSQRGPGLDMGLKILSAVREKLAVPVLSDVHSEQEARAAGKVLDILQVPALLCRQTDILLAAAGTGRPVNVKKGQFLAPGDMKNVVEKLRAGGAESIILTERGTSFGYNNLVADMRSIPLMQDLGCPVVIDATHSVQLPGAGGASSGGERRFVQTIALAGIAAGADGLFLEVHPDPDNAPCDALNMLELSSLEGVLEKALALYNALRER